MKNLCGRFTDRVLKACDGMCGIKRGRRSKGDTWWWNEDVKEALLWKKDAHRATCQDNAEENNRRYESI